MRCPKSLLCNHTVIKSSKAFLTTMSVFRRTTELSKNITTHKVCRPTLVHAALF